MWLNFEQLKKVKPKLQMLGVIPITNKNITHHENLNNLICI